MLAATSAEIDSGKSTLVAVAGRMSPRYSLNIEMTGPSLYRMVDATKPTLVIDEADDLFLRKSDLKHIVNAGWTRGPKIPPTRKNQRCFDNGVLRSLHAESDCPTRAQSGPGDALPLH